MLCMHACWFWPTDSTSCMHLNTSHYGLSCFTKYACIDAWTVRAWPQWSLPLLLMFRWKWVWTCFGSGKGWHADCCAAAVSPNLLWIQGTAVAPSSVTWLSLYACMHACIKFTVDSYADNLWPYCRPPFLQSRPLKRMHADSTNTNCSAHLRICLAILWFRCYAMLSTALMLSKLISWIRYHGFV